MPGITLLASTGVAAIDQILRECIALIEQQLSGRVRGYYLVGSYAYGEVLPSSDIDLLVLLEQEPAQEDRERFARAREACRRPSAIPRYAGRGKKSDIPRQYAIWVGGEWAGRVADVFDLCPFAGATAYPKHKLISTICA